MPKKQPERRRTYIRNVDKAEGMAHEEEKEREEKKDIKQRLDTGSGKNIGAEES